jgi:hypothetical protein
MNLDFLTVGAITVIVYGIAAVIKSMSTAEKLMKEVDQLPTRPMEEI